MWSSSVSWRIREIGLSGSIRGRFGSCSSKNQRPDMEGSSCLGYDSGLGEDEEGKQEAEEADSEMFSLCGESG